MWSLTWTAPPNPREVADNDGELLNAKMANSHAKDGPTVYPERLDSPPPHADAAARSLATGVLELCALCENLLTLAAAHDAAPEHLTVISEQLEAVRATASPLAVTPGVETDPDPYSLSLLGQWVWRE